MIASLKFTKMQREKCVKLLKNSWAALPLSHSADTTCRDVDCAFVKEPLREDMLTRLITHGV